MLVQNKGLYEDVSTVVQRHALALNTQYPNNVLPIADGEAVAQWAKERAHYTECHTQRTP